MQQWLRVYSRTKRHLQKKAASGLPKLQAAFSCLLVVCVLRYVRFKSVNNLTSPRPISL